MRQRHLAVAFIETPVNQHRQALGPPANHLARRIAQTRQGQRGHLQPDGAHLVGGAADDVRQQLSGWVVMTPQWLQWLWSHVNYHEVHHKYPYLSHQYLPQAFEASRGQYPYLVVDGYWKAVGNAMKLDYYGKPEGVRQFMAVTSSAP